MKCKQCGKPVTRDVQGNLVRECEHHDAPVLVQGTAKLIGKSTVK